MANIKTSERPGLIEKVGYGLGDTASNIVFQGVNLLLLYYYTDVFRLSPALVGFIFAAVRIWDAVNDPLMGIIADRTNTRYGKYRPYLLWMAMPFGLLIILTFAAPPIAEAYKPAYAAITYLLLMMIYTAINVPYSALMGVMTPDAEQRTILSTFRFVGAVSAALLIGMAARPLVSLFGGGQGSPGFDEATGFRITFFLFAALAVIMFLITFAVTRERVAPMKEVDPDIRQDLKALLRNRAWLIMAAAGVFTLSSVAVRGAVMFHFFKYYVGDEGGPYFWFLDQTSFFLTLYSLAFIAGLFFTNRLRKWFGKRNALIGTTTLQALFMIGFYVIPADQFVLMVVIGAIGNFFAGPGPALVWAMYTDVADYSEWTSGRRSTALVFSAAMFAQKMGLTIGGAASGFLLAYVGFVANQAQTPEAMTGLRVIFSIVPGVLALLNAVVLIFYPICERDVAAMSAELEARRHKDAIA